MIHSAFDPRPHIQTLEQALALLLPLRKANAAKIVELERSAAAAERAYRGDVRGAKAGFEVRVILEFATSACTQASHLRLDCQHSISGSRLEYIKRW
jgi:hypothetical protein